MPIEYEAKFLNIDKEAIRKALSLVDYECVLPEFLYKRQTFDVPGYGVEKWGRVRLEKEVINLNIKHTVDVSRVDGTHETQINLPIGENPAQQFEEAIDFMIACGLSPAGFQENKREIWIKDDIEICIDTWPGVKTYIEIEATDEEAVRKACVELNLDFNVALFGGITTVYEAELGMSGEEFSKLKEVTFEKPPIRVSAEI
jgi:adenylate cyclase class IV